MASTRPRRVRTDPAPGADPSPQRLDDGRPAEVELAGEDRLGAWGDDGLDVLPDAASSSNDERLERDRPPHYA
ncbi:MAG: hypothetical protein ACTH31_06310 [Pseudoclavibacter sp.]